MENIAEREFQKWLDYHEIPYWYIQQDVNTFSEGLKNQFLKRPDFFILIPNFGFILVDIKDKNTAKKYEKFFIGAQEVEKYINLQRIFNMPMWFIISNSSYHYKTWFWMPLTNLMSSGFLFNPKEDKERACYSIALSKFIQVSYEDSLERVFVKLLNFN